MKKKKQKNKPSIGDKRQNAQQQKAEAEEMRLKAMETMGQTKRAGDAIGYLENKAEHEMALIVEGRDQNEKTRGDERFSADNNAAGDAKLGSFRKNSKTNLKQQQRYQNQQLQFM